MSESAFHYKSGIVVWAIEWKDISYDEVELVDSEFIKEDGSNSISDKSASDDHFSDNDRCFFGVD